MKIRELSLCPFRNFHCKRINFDQDRTLIYGDNGQGKSNILEAVSFLSLGKSVRSIRDREAVPYHGRYFDIRARGEKNRRDCFLRLFYSTDDGKKAFSNHAPLDRVSDIIGTLRTVHFSPEDASLVLRFPAQRRRLLDILISQACAPYLRDLQHYQRALTQRNHLLRRLRQDISSSDESALLVWDAHVAELGGRVRYQRLLTVGEIRGFFVKVYQRFAPQNELADISYRGPEECEENALQEELLRKLHSHRGRDCQQGYTYCGPQRDDLEFKTNGRPAETYASEGQLKSILIAWKMAEVYYLEESTGQQPVLLLDDLFSELDEHRVIELLELIHEFEQVVVTTPRDLGTAIRKSFSEIHLGDYE